MSNSIIPYVWSAMWADKSIFMVLTYLDPRDLLEMVSTSKSAVVGMNGPDTYEFWGEIASRIGMIRNTYRSATKDEIKRGVAEICNKKGWTIVDHFKHEGVLDTYRISVPKIFTMRTPELKKHLIYRAQQLDVEEHYDTITYCDWCHRHIHNCSEWSPSNYHDIYQMHLCYQCSVNDHFDVIYAPDIKELLKKKGKFHSSVEHIQRVCKRTVNGKWLRSDVKAYLELPKKMYRIPFLHQRLMIDPVYPLARGKRKREEED